MNRENELILEAYQKMYKNITINEATQSMLDKVVTLEIDCNNDDSLPLDEYTKQMTKEGKGKLKFKLLKAKGPGGGNPLYSITGTPKDILDWASKYYGFTSVEEFLMAFPEWSEDKKDEMLKKYKDVADYYVKLAKKVGPQHLDLWKYGNK